MYKNQLFGLFLVCLIIPLDNHSTAQQPTKKPTESDILYQEDVVYGRVHGAGLLADIAYPLKVEKPGSPAIISVHVLGFVSHRL